MPKCPSMWEGDEMEKGWIKLYRSIMEHWIYQEKPFTKFQAWADILLNVNHKDNKVLFEGSLIEVKRGQMLTSEVKLANRWGWSRKKTRNFLKMLEDEEMIKRTVIPNKGILIFVINYDLYQNGTTEDTIKRIENTEIDEIKGQQDTQQRNNSGTTQEQLRNTNKNDNNGKNDKNGKEIYKYIVAYLNEKADKNFRATTKKTQSLINARIREGFSLDDFKKVIDIKCKQWLGTEMEKYLRPETLFGTKFESYLNEKEYKPEQSSWRGSERRLDSLGEKSKENDDPYAGIGFTYEDLQELDRLNK